MSEMKMSVGLAPSEGDEGESVLCLSLASGGLQTSLEVFGLHAHSLISAFKDTWRSPCACVCVHVSLFHGELSYCIRGPHYSSMASS